MPSFSPPLRTFEGQQEGPLVLAIEGDSMGHWLVQDSGGVKWLPVEEVTKRHIGIRRESDPDIISTFSPPFRAQDQHGRWQTWYAMKAPGWAAWRTDEWLSAFDGERPSWNRYEPVVPKDIKDPEG